MLLAWITDGDHSCFPLNSAFASRVYNYVNHHVSLFCQWKYWITLFKVKFTAKVQISVHLSRYHLNCWTCCNQTWYGNTSSWAKMSGEKNWDTFVKLTVRAYVIKTWLFMLFYSFWTVDSFATNPNFMVDHYKLRCPVKILDCCAVVKVKVAAKAEYFS